MTAPTRPYRVASCFPHHAGGHGHYHACLSIHEGLPSPELAVELHVPTSDPSGRRPFTREAVPPWLKGAAYRLDPGQRLVKAWLRRSYRAALARADAAYLWAAIPEPMYADVGASGLPLFVERINTHRAMARRVLEEASRRAGVPATHGITDEAIAEERRKLAQADRVFSPSPVVTRSLLEEGVPPEKVLPASYGWSPERLGGATRSRPADDRPVFLYAGTGCIRKGLHLLLDAWASADVRARLDIVGTVLEEVCRTSSDHLGREDVRRAGFAPHIAQAYADADVFVLPTVEEGSPLVIHEAMSFGLPVLTTPAGAGEVVRHDVEGMVLDPYDRDAWVHALRRLAADPDLRARMGAAARERSREFTWDRVAERRRALLLGALRELGRTPR